MFRPGLGVSLQVISDGLDQESLAAVAASRIVTLEVYAALFESDRGAKMAALQEMIRRTDIRPMTIHALFGRDHDWSDLDEGVYQNALRSAKASVRLAVHLGAPMIVVHASGEPVGDRERDQRLQQVLRAMQEITPLCQSTDKRIAIELLPRTCLGNTVVELLWLLDRLDRETFGVCLDVNHLMDRYETLPDAVRELGENLITTHLSDYDGIDEKHWLPGKGVIDWKAFMDALRDIDYQGPFNYECGLEGDIPSERIYSLETNYDWLSGL